MRFFRLHTIRITILLVLSAGLVPFLSPWQTVDAEADQFAKWLSKLAKDDAKDQVDDKVRDLDNTDDVIKSATKLIYNHTEWFALDLDDASEHTDEEIYQLIKKEWRSYQQGSTMGGEMAIERHHRPGWTPEKHLFAGLLNYSSGKSAFEIPQAEVLLTGELQPNIDNAPLLTDISIRAP